MNIRQVKILCQLDGKPREHTLVAFELDPATDSAIIDEALERGTKQGGVSLNPAGWERSQDTLLKTRYLGAVSEMLLEQYLTRQLGVTTQSKPFTSYNEHVDLEIVTAQKTLTIEVRGSYPFSSMPRVICDLFDIIGPYVTAYKSKETPKDYYLRTLIHSSVDDFDPKQAHTVYFAGGGRGRAVR